MAAPHRTSYPTRLANLAVLLTDDGSRTLIRPDTDDSYHSGAGALSETRHVYLSNSGVESRLRAGVPTSVLEIGLGTGMGMLLTIDAAAQSSAALDYVCLENQWLPADILRQLKPHEWVARQSLVDRFLQYRESLPARVEDGSYTWQVDEKQSVTVHHTDALSHRFDEGKLFHAVYFDPFAPESDAELWQRPLLARIYDVMTDDARLVTYCVSRRVREAMASVGLDVLRVPGPAGGKRQVMIATKRNGSLVSGSAVETTNPP